VPKAEITTINVGTNEPSKAISTGSGQYRIFNLLPAQYTLVFSAPGFKTVTVGSVKLDMGEALTQNSMLPVGAVTDTVNVAAEGQLLETMTVGNSTLIEQKQINDLPLNSRSYTSLIALTLGARAFFFGV
jgi:hypothetical protein